MNFYGADTGDQVQSELFTVSGELMRSLNHADEFGPESIGLLALDYHTVEPPMTLIHRILGMVGLRNAAWRITRAIRRMRKQHDQWIAMVSSSRRLRSNCRT